VNASPPELRAALERAQAAGMLGPDDVDRQIAHALEFLRPFAVERDAACLDLGSGGGVPGLPLILAYPRTRWTLVDAWQARCDHLVRAVHALGVDDRVAVMHARAEAAGRGPLRTAADVVVARSFGPPPSTAECAGPLLRRGGRLVVSVAEEATWPAAIPEVGLLAERSWQTPSGAFRSYVRTGDVDVRFPRRPSAQRRSPLFAS
jgi:precorrin-6B methylase 2